MSEANAYLLEQYGTGVFLKEAKKAGGLPASARIAAAILSMGLAEAVRRDEQDDQLKDRAAEEHVRMMEAKSMEATLEALKVSSVNHAVSIGQMMAQEELEKDAALPVLPFLARAGAKALKGIGKVVRAPSATARLQQAAKGVAGPAPRAAMKGDVLSTPRGARRVATKPGLQERAGKGVERAGQRLGRAGAPAPRAGAAAPPPLPPTVRPGPAPAPASRDITGATIVGAKPLGPAAAPASGPLAQRAAPTAPIAGPIGPSAAPTSGPLVAPKPPAGTVAPPPASAPAQKPTRSGTMSAEGTRAPEKTKTPDAAPAAPEEPAKALMSMGTKAKLLGAGTVLGGGYLATQALGTAKDLLMRPRGGAYRYGSSPGMRQVSQYGYPMY